MGMSASLLKSDLSYVQLCLTSAHMRLTSRQKVPIRSFNTLICPTVRRVLHTCVKAPNDEPVPAVPGRKQCRLSRMLLRMFKHHRRRRPVLFCIGGEKWHLSSSVSSSADYSCLGTCQESESGSSARDSFTFYLGDCRDEAVSLPLAFPRREIFHESSWKLRNERHRIGRIVETENQSVRRGRHTALERAEGPRSGGPRYVRAILQFLRFSPRARVRIHGHVGKCTTMETANEPLFKINR